jgi:hypothetical protein
MPMSGSYSHSGSLYFCPQQKTRPGRKTGPKTAIRELFISSDCKNKAHLGLFSNGVRNGLLFDLKYGNRGLYRARIRVSMYHACTQDLVGMAPFSSRCPPRTRIKIFRLFRKISDEVTGHFSKSPARFMKIFKKVRHRISNIFKISTDPEQQFRKKWCESQPIMETGQEPVPEYPAYLIPHD